MLSGRNVHKEEIKNCFCFISRRKFSFKKVEERLRRKSFCSFCNEFRLVESRELSEEGSNSWCRRRLLMRRFRFRFKIFLPQKAFMLEDRSRGRCFLFLWFIKSQAWKYLIFGHKFVQMRIEKWKKKLGGREVVEFTTWRKDFSWTFSVGRFVWNKHRRRDCKSTTWVSPSRRHRSGNCYQLHCLSNVSLTPANRLSWSS